MNNELNDLFRDLFQFRATPLKNRGLRKVKNLVVPLTKLSTDILTESGSAGMNYLPFSKLKKPNKSSVPTGNVILSIQDRATICLNLSNFV